MGCCTPRMLLILFSISWCFSRVSADSKIFTAAFMAVSGTTDLPEYVGVGMINGVPVVRYDSDTRQTVSLQQWMTDAYDANYWKILTKQGNDHSDKARKDLRMVMKCTNQTSGVHILQFIRTVEITADGSIKRSMNVGFDGKDFISLEPDRMRWVAANHFAVKIKENWDSDKAWNRHWKWHLEEELVERLKSRLHFGKQYFERKVQPEVFISRREPNGQDKPLTLSCLVTGFYPVDIEVTWLRNGEVMSETQSSGVRPNHDGTHQIQKEIEINAGDEDQYCCQIEHSSLAEAKLFQWEIPQWSHLSIILIIIGSVTGLAVVFGIIIWRRSYRAQPFLETRPTLHQQEVMDKNVELKLMSKSEPQLKTQPLQGESKYPRGLEEGNEAVNKEESPSETDKLNPASNVSDGNTVKYHLGSHVTEFLPTSEEQ
ncbi:class I histocompatibility antigen, F10 alpha chain-like [Hemiscyllium ocellatum]|uniref:class I histocompatibility antigen, F10 alpha chain-like n=1 Tax=Hemiscyllium ocellatum TaxID=170820 RepID=UPI00296744BD|nr:class I histocompatibility antigen, F10 alpha chain-like [Hemiscyllium ocellatum]